MPSPPRSDADRDYYQWVLSNSGWATYYNSEGRPVQPAGLPPPSPPPPSPFDHMEDCGLAFILDEIESLSLSMPGRYPTAMAHDGEASGSQAPSDFVTGLAETIFSTPSPPPATILGDDNPWETASRIMSEVDAAAAAACDAVWAGLPDRYNRGQVAQRYSPSPFRR